MNRSLSSSNKLSTYSYFSFFFFNDTATTEIYTLSLHDALPIFDHPRQGQRDRGRGRVARVHDVVGHALAGQDRKSTRLNSSHGYISYAVFCLKKKKDSEYCATPTIRRHNSNTIHHRRDTRS